MKDIVEAVRNAGVVGAGGAGFPTHVKLAAKAEYVLGNGAECEPLLHKDAELSRTHASQVIKGMELSKEATGASHGIYGIKGKRKSAIASLETAIANSSVSIQQFRDYYPAGDEYELVHKCTGRLIPPGGIPLNVGVVVHNTESLYNIAEAVEGRPVTEKIISLAGAVAHPITTRVPLGITLAEVLEIAGGLTCNDAVFFIGGLMMGRIEKDLSKPVTKTTGALIALPADHSLVTRMTKPQQAMRKIGKSACDQCSYCTEMCPRYLLGYDVQPHKVMRTLGFSATGTANWSKWADLCCSCGLCTLFACPEDLFPREACNDAVADRKTAGLQRWLGPEREMKAHPMEQGRHIPVKALVRKLGVSAYDVMAPWTERNYDPRQVTLPLQQHVGAPSEPVVKVGDLVTKGQLIAEITKDKLGARIHSSMDGKITSINGSITIERR